MPNAAEDRYRLESHEPLEAGQQHWGAFVLSDYQARSDSYVFLALLHPIVPYNVLLRWAGNFHETLQEGYPELVYIDLGRQLLFSMNLSCRITRRSNQTA